MDLSFNTLKKLLLNPDLTESQIVKDLETVSKNFTTNRDAINQYSKSIDFVCAYTMFYLPTNFPKFSFILDQLDKSIIEQLQKTTFIDVGCGPGTYGLAFREYFGNSSPLILVDQSETMLNQASKIMVHFFPDFKNISFQSNLDSLKTSGDITLFFGNSINEIGFEKTLEIVEKIKPKFLFFIEPGTKEFFEIALKIRNEMAIRGHSVLYPCPSLIDGCPLEHKDDWCHQILRSTHDPSIERLSQLIKKDRRVMPLTSHLYLLEGNLEKTSTIRGRLIRFIKETKFAFIWEVCLEEREKIVTKRFEVLTKKLSISDYKKLNKSSIGINVDFELIKKISPDIWRVELKASSLLQD